MGMGTVRGLRCGDGLGTCLLTCTTNEAWPGWDLPIPIIPVGIRTTLSSIRVLARSWPPT